jgi:hypothetical protein
VCTRLLLLLLRLLPLLQRLQLAPPRGPEARRHDDVKSGWGAGEQADAGLCSILHA